jgi:hypothetical protein
LDWLLVGWFHSFKRKFPMKSSQLSAIAALLACLHGVASFTSSPKARTISSTASLAAVSQDRRTVLCTGLALGTMMLGMPVYADTGAEVRGIGVNPFNSLIFQYRGSDYGGLKASDLNEPSIPYATFVERLKAGEVEFVEFLAPHGDVAYATFKTKNGEGKSTPIRIGEGTLRFVFASILVNLYCTVSHAGVSFHPYLL